MSAGEPVQSRAQVTPPHGFKFERRIVQGPGDVERTILVDPSWVPCPSVTHAKDKLYVLLGHQVATSHVEDGAPLHRLSVFEIRRSDGYVIGKVSAVEFRSVEAMRERVGNGFETHMHVERFIALAGRAYLNESKLNELRESAIPVATLAANLGAVKVLRTVRRDVEAKHQNETSRTALLRNSIQYPAKQIAEMGLADDPRVQELRRNSSVWNRLGCVTPQMVSEVANGLNRKEYGRGESFDDVENAVWAYIESGDLVETTVRNLKLTELGKAVLAAVQQTREQEGSNFHTNLEAVLSEAKKLAAKEDVAQPGESEAQPKKKTRGRPVNMGISATVRDLVETSLLINLMTPAVLQDFCRAVPNLICIDAVEGVCRRSTPPVASSEERSSLPGTLSQLSPLPLSPTAS